MDIVTAYILVAALLVWTVHNSWSAIWQPKRLKLIAQSWPTWILVHGVAISLVLSGHSSKTLLKMMPPPPPPAPSPQPSEPAQPEPPIHTDPRTVTPLVPSWAQPVPLNHTKVAVLITSRFQPIDTATILHNIQHIPADWPVDLWVTDEIKAHMLGSFLTRKLVDSGRLKFTIMSEDKVIKSRDDYSRMLTTPWFYEQFEQEYMFIFQTDVAFCAAAATTLDDWLGYTYVGAPVGWSMADGHAGGNGGASIRRVSDMLRTTRQFTWEQGEIEEDGWLSINAHEHMPDMNWPLDKDQHDFSLSYSRVELPRGKHNWPLLAHADAGISPVLEIYCPETNLILIWWKHVRPDTTPLWHTPGFQPLNPWPYP